MIKSPVVLRKIKIRNADGIKGLKNLSNFLVSEGCSSMVEIGSYAGESALIFSKYFDIIYCIDPWEESTFCPDIEGILKNCDHSARIIEHCFDENTRNTKKIKKIKNYDHNVLCEFDKIDFVYIDAIHTYQELIAQISRWLPKCRYIGGHDYDMNHVGVIQAVNEKFNNILTFSDTSWLAI